MNSTGSASPAATSTGYRKACPSPVSGSSSARCSRQLLRSITSDRRPAFNNRTRGALSHLASIRHAGPAAPRQISAASGRRQQVVRAVGGSRDEAELPDEDGTLTQGDLFRSTEGSQVTAAVGDLLQANPAKAVSRWKRRWTVVALCFVAFMLCNMDRVNMSIAILPMAKQYAWDSATIGLVQSSFFWGYLLTQVAGGVWADKFGGKPILGFGVMWWSVATALTPLAAQLGLPALLTARACMGIGEGVAMPAMNNLLSRWVPKQERSRSLALVYSGMYTGSILGLALSPHMVASLGWASVFYIFGSMGVVWFALWVQNASSGPNEDSLVSQEESAYIIANTCDQSSVGDIPWKLLFSKPAVWALIIAHFCHNWGTFILLTWMPTYYNQVLGFDLMKSGIFSVLPWMTMAITSNIGGYIADKMVSRGVSVTTVRKVMQSIGFLGPAFFLTQLSHVSSPFWAVACMMASQGLDAFSQSGLYSNHQDIGPRYAGVLLGISNTAGVLAGVLGTAATGYILKTGTWDEVWGVAVGLYLVGTVVWNLFSTGEQVFD